VEDDDTVQCSTCGCWVPPDEIAEGGDDCVDCDAERELEERRSDYRHSVL